MSMITSSNKPAEVKRLRSGHGPGLGDALAAALVRFQLFERIGGVVPPLPGEGHEDAGRIFNSHGAVQVP